MLKALVEKEKLLFALSKAQPIVDKKTIMQIINNIYLYTKDQRLFIEATDLEIFFRTSIPAQITEDGELTISGRKLYEIIKEIPQENINLEELENHWIKIHVSEKAEYTIAGTSADEFPKFANFPDDSEFLTVPSIIFKDLIDKTIFSVSFDERKYALSGILLETFKDEETDKLIIRMVSSDGHRLNLAQKELDIEYPLSKKKSVIILRKGANEIRKVSDYSEEISFASDKKFFYVKAQENQFIIRLIDGSFPNYEAIIPKAKIRSFTFDRKTLISALKRISILIPDPSYKGIKISIGPNRMHIESMEKKIGEAQETIDISYSGEPFELALNARYLIEALQVMKSEEVEFTFNDEDSPCTVIGDEDPGFIGLIMPMSLEDE